MFKNLSLLIVLFFLAGSSFATGKKEMTTPRCTAKAEKKVLKVQQPAGDVFKTKYWLISVIFRQ